MKQNVIEYSHDHFPKGMGNIHLHSKGRTLTDADIRLLSQHTQLEPHLIQQLHEAFIERAGKDGR